MNPIIKPAFYLMNRLSYRHKLMLISSLFAVPLLLFAVQLAYSYHQEANQAKLTKSGLSYLQETTYLIENLETLRDITVITSWQSLTALNKSFESAKRSALSKISLLKKQTSAETNDDFLYQLEKTLNENNFVRGNEAESIDGVFDAAHQLVSQAYGWRRKLSYAFVSRSRNNPDIVAIINMLNEANIFLTRLGQTRTYGTMYLEQKFVDSYGVSVLEKNDQGLAQLISLIDIKTEEYKSVIKSYSEMQPQAFRENLIQARDLIYEQLVLTTAITGNAVKFFDDLSDIIQAQYTHNQILFSLSSKLVSQDYEKSVQRLIAFYCSLAFLVLLLVYLIAGLYQAIGLTIQDLMNSADRVATGQYETPIRVQSKDELADVAAAMDAMRLKIKDREEALSLMGQTDGLTQLYNRQYFDDALDLALANSRRNPTPLTLVMMDIDRFKALNDEYGHQTGDECLRQVAKLMGAQFQRQTDIVARYGGEEFIAILYGQTLSEATQRTEQLREAIENNKIKIGDREISVTASFGLAALTPPESCQNKELVGLADRLLYQSKKEGKNRLSAGHYHQDMI